MIALPEGLNIQSDDDIEKTVRELQQYMRYMTEHLNKAILELSGRIDALEREVVLNGD